MTTTNHGPFGPNGERPPGWPPPPFDPPGEPLPYVPPPDPPGSSSEPGPIGGPRTGYGLRCPSPRSKCWYRHPAKHHLAAATSASSIPLPPGYHWPDNLPPGHPGHDVKPPKPPGGSGDAGSEGSGDEAGSSDSKDVDDLELPNLEFHAAHACNLSCAQCRIIPTFLLAESLVSKRLARTSMHGRPASAQTDRSTRGRTNSTRVDFNHRAMQDSRFQTPKDVRLTDSSWIVLACPRF